MDCSGPLDLEIGCGVGWHPIRRAKAHPERRLIAIEHTHERFGKFAGRYQRNGSPQNLLPVHADAVEWVTHYVPAGSVSECFLLYPNPNPKPAHLSRRWHAMPFFARLRDSLADGGKITLATNLEGYAREFADYGARVWGLELESFEPWKGAPRTHFEKKYLARGEVCWNVELRVVVSRRRR